MQKGKSLRKVICVLAITFFVTAVSAQTVTSRFDNPSSYKFGAGVLIDFGDGATLVGPHAKYFFTPNHAGEGAILFGSGATYIQGLYNYNMGFPEVDGLGWYIGAGPSIAFGSGSTAFSILGSLGIEYSIPAAPFALSFDWRPRFFIIDSYTEFVAPRFGLGVRYTFN